MKRQALKPHIAFLNAQKGAGRVKSEIRVQTSNHEKNALHAVPVPERAHSD